MEVVLTNPIGLWALLGIPAVLAIHFLQQQSKELVISTRFLLDQMKKESVEGRKLERLRSSIPLWLQLLMVLLLAWLLVGPRWQRADSVQRTAIVLDSSASMRAFREEAVNAIADTLDELGSSASKAEFVLIDSQLRNESLYHGASLEEMLAVLETWEPFGGAHDFTPAIQVGHSLVGREGTIVLVTDHAMDELPFNARLLAVGEPVANCGFSGLRVGGDRDDPRWKVVVRNYSDTPQTREWHLEVAGQASPSQSIDLAPGRSITLQGAFPPGADACSLHLEPDAFTLDDTLPVVRTTPKQLTARRSVTPGYEALVDTVAEAIENLENAAEDADPDLAFATYNPLSPGFPETNAVVAVTQRLKENKVLQGAVVSTNHPLVADLNWQSLVARSSMTLPRRENDEVLLWQGKRPLILLRRGDTFRQLIFNFDLTASNADRLPALILTINRFAESIRETKIALETLNAELNQPLNIAFDRTPGAPPLITKTIAESGPGETVTEVDRAGSLRAPEAPGFFQISQGDADLVRGAVHFADAREADFRQAVSENRVDGVTSSLVERHTREDPYWRIWVVLLGVLLLLNWYFTGRRKVAPGGKRPVVSLDPAP